MSTCPAPERLGHLLADLLEDPERREVRAHADVCSRC